ncbi:virion structural protein [Erwinia phage Machina]|uniref:Uncharacterized protein n=1 Tax=Erwinia phage Machina TaxID=1883375 RepID=A0A1B2IEQ7_9CAUD|nr:virion structural protein [Erwinia phage Machina]ANZ49733.1 hypothetical protein MACHINA_95 [Erwinia phage Machina]
MPYRIDLSKPPHEILVNRINYVWGTSYRPDQVEFNSRGAWPLTKEERRARGVESKIAARFKNGVMGFQEFHLTRADLTELLEGVVVEVPMGITWSHYLVPYIIDELGLQLGPYDLVIEPLEGNFTTYVARIEPHHPSFKGTIDIKFVDPTPRKLTDLVTKYKLDGFRVGEFFDG